MKKQEDKLARCLKVLSVSTRLRIVQLLKGRALCVNALAHRLGVTQSAISQHLRVLRDAGIVIDEKCGYYVHYRLNEKTLAKWKDAINVIFDVKFDNCPGKKGNTKWLLPRKQRSMPEARELERKTGGLFT